MAVLKNLPSLAIINGFKGSIDFYVYNGIPVARRWPCSPGKQRAPAVEAQWPAFSFASKNWNSISPTVQDAYRATVRGTHMSGRDLFVKAYLSDYFRAGQWSPYDTPLDPHLHYLTLTWEPYRSCAGMKFVTTTNLPCHGYLFYTSQPWWTHRVPMMRRGTYFRDLSYWCFTNWRYVEQEEVGDTLTHTFFIEPWELCEIRWLTPRATVNGIWATSSGPIFEHHRHLLSEAVRFASHRVPLDEAWAVERDYFMAQAFVPEWCPSLTNVFIYVKRPYESTDGTFHVQLRSDEDGHPSTTILAEETFNILGWPVDSPISLRLPCYGILAPQDTPTWIVTQRTNYTYWWSYPWWYADVGDIYPIGRTFWAENTDGPWYGPAIGISLGFAAYGV